nr:hypothetical protein CFP56_54450 [Quercus suber]
MWCTSSIFSYASIWPYKQQAPRRSTSLCPPCSSRLLLSTSTSDPGARVAAGHGYVPALSITFNYLNPEASEELNIAAIEKS